MMNAVWNTRNTNIVRGYDFKNGLIKRLKPLKSLKEIYMSIEKVICIPSAINLVITLKKYPFLIISFFKWQHIFTTIIQGFFYFLWNFTPTCLKIFSSLSQNISTDGRNHLTLEKRGKGVGKKDRLFAFILLCLKEWFRRNKEIKVEK